MQYMEGDLFAVKSVPIKSSSDAVVRCLVAKILAGGVLCQMVTAGLELKSGVLAWIGDVK